MKGLEHGIEEKPFDINELWARISDESKEVIIKPQDTDPEGNLLVFSEGPKSNLNEQNWKIVRTKSFIKWFGNWQEKKDCSMVVDENGEPKIVTHRTYDDEIILEPARTKFSESSRFMHFTSKWVGGKPSWRYGNNIHMAFLNIRNFFNSRHGRQRLPYYDYPNSEKAGFIGCIDDDFLKWLLKKGYDGIYDPGIDKADDREEPAMYTDQYVVLDPQKQVIFIDMVNAEKK